MAYPLTPEEIAALMDDSPPYISISIPDNIQKPSKYYKTPEAHESAPYSIPSNYQTKSIIDESLIEIAGWSKYNHKQYQPAQPNTTIASPKDTPAKPTTTIIESKPIEVKPRIIPFGLTDRELCI